MEQKIDRITDILRRDDGISGAMHYTEQISWILFLKFLNDYEEEKANASLLSGTDYEYVLPKKYRWCEWACPKDTNGKIDLKKSMTGDDLTSFVNNSLFPYLKKFRNSSEEVKSLKYKIGEIFSYLDNRIQSGHTLREILDILDNVNFQSQDELFELSNIYEKLLIGMGNDGGNSGEFYTPRPVIRAMVNALAPKVGQTVYDGAAGTCGFLIQAYEYMKKERNLNTSNWTKLHENTFYGYEKTPLAYIMGTMNMILHGIESPNLYHRNTLTTDIRQFQEKDRYDIILANPPFGGKEKTQIEQNFPIKSNATELLFLQHFMKILKKGGKAAIVVPEGVLFQTNNAFTQVKRELLENFNLHTILSLPAGVFLPYSGVKTNVIFFERNGSTSNIWYYEVNSEAKLTKNKPIQDNHLEEFGKLYKKRVDSENSWTVNVDEVVKLDYDLSAKNPNVEENIEHLPPKKIIKKIQVNSNNIDNLINEIESILAG